MPALAPIPVRKPHLVELFAVKTAPAEAAIPLDLPDQHAASSYNSVVAAVRYYDRHRRPQPLANSRDHGVTRERVHDVLQHDAAGLQGISRFPDIAAALSVQLAAHSTTLNAQKGVIADGAPFVLPLGEYKAARRLVNDFRAAVGAIAPLLERPGTPTTLGAVKPFVAAARGVQSAGAVLVNAYNGGSLLRSGFDLSAADEERCIARYDWTVPFPLAEGSHSVRRASPYDLASYQDVFISAFLASPESPTHAMLGEVTRMIQPYTAIALRGGATVTTKPPRALGLTNWLSERIKA